MINKVRDRFRSCEHVYTCFLEVLKQYRHSQVGVQETYDRVCAQDTVAFVAVTAY